MNDTHSRRQVLRASAIKDFHEGQVPSSEKPSQVLTTMETSGSKDGGWQESCRRGCRAGCCSSYSKLPGIDGHALGGVLGLVDPHQAVCQLEHVVAQADDDELRVLRLLLDVVGHDGHVLEVCNKPKTNISSGPAYGQASAVADAFRTLWRWVGMT